MAFKAKMGEFLNDVKSSMPAFTLSPSKPAKREAVKDEKMKIKFLEAWNNLRYDLGSGAPLKKDIPIWILGKCYHARASLPVTYDDDEEDVPDFEDAPVHAKAVFMDFASRPWFTYRKQFPPIKGTDITSDTGWGCMLRSAQMMLAQGLLLHFLGRDWRWLQRQSQRDKHLHRMVLEWFVDSPTLQCPLSVHHLAEIGRKFGNIPGNWYGPNTVAYIVQEAVRRAKSTTPQLREIAVYVAQDCTVYSGDVYKLCGWKEGGPEQRRNDESEVHTEEPSSRRRSVITDADFQDSLSTSSASSHGSAGNCSESSEVSSFVIPAIPAEDLVTPKSTSNAIPMTQLFYPMNSDIEVSLKPPKSSRDKIHKHHGVARHGGMQTQRESNHQAITANRDKSQKNGEWSHTVHSTNASCRQGLNSANSRPQTNPEARTYRLVRTDVLPNDQGWPSWQDSQVASACHSQNSGLVGKSDGLEQITFATRTSRECSTRTPLPDIARTYDSRNCHSHSYASHSEGRSHEPRTDVCTNAEIHTNTESLPDLPAKEHARCSLDEQDRKQLPHHCDKNSNDRTTVQNSYEVSPERAVAEDRSLAGDKQSMEAAALILVPVRLGESVLNPVYIPHMQEVLSMVHSIGIIGGKPKHSLYFVGFQDENLLHLDPHYCQTADKPMGFRKNLHNYHTMSIRKTNIRKVDPSCCLGFYCRTAKDFEVFKREAKQNFSAEKFTTYPMYLVMDGCSGDHHPRSPSTPEDLGKSSSLQKPHPEEGDPEINSSTSERASCDPTPSLNIASAEGRTGVRSIREHVPEHQKAHLSRSPRKGHTKTSTEELTAKLNRLLPDKSKFYPKFMRQKSSSPSSKRKNLEKQDSLEHEFELL